MKIVVIGGTGLIGTKLTARLRALGHDVTPASPTTGVDTITGAGLAPALAGADVLVDVSNAPSFDADAVLRFFETSTRHQLAAAAAAGVGHVVALSVVGNDRMPDSAYQRAKGVQERLIRESGLPFSIVRATQFFEFLAGIADAATSGGTVRVAPALIQPVAADDVAVAVARAAVSAPVDGVVEVGGPEVFRQDELLRRVLEAKGDARTVVADPLARYFGALLTERTLVPGEGAQQGRTRLDEWRRTGAPFHVAQGRR
jgi:uncharacterized protein YbjT (DUF2867 family)